MKHFWLMITGLTLYSMALTSKADVPSCPETALTAAVFLSSLTDTNPDGWTDASGGGIYSYDSLSGVYVGSSDITGSFAYQCVAKEGTGNYFLNCSTVDGALQNYSCISKKQ